MGVWDTVLVRGGNDVIALARGVGEGGTLTQRLLVQERKCE